MTNTVDIIIENEDGTTTVETSKVAEVTPEVMDILNKMIDGEMTFEAANAAIFGA